MKRLILVAVVALLAACTPVPGPLPTLTASGSGSPTPVASATETPGPVVQTVVNAEDYLLEGGIGVDTDGDGMWSAHYGFYIEQSKSVRCDIYIFSGDAPSVHCQVVPGNESKVTYDLPSGAVCDESSSNAYDGYSMALNAQGLYPNLAGFSGCQSIYYIDSAMAAATKTLGEGQEIQTDPFGCVVNGEAVGCYFLDGRDGSFIFSLYTAVHAG